MTYDSYEQSVASGEPIELYDIWDNGGTHYRYTTASEAVEYNGYMYESDVIDRSEMELGGNEEVTALKVFFSRSNALTNQFISGPPEGEVQLLLYRQHAGFTATFWQGFLIVVTFDENSVPTGRFEPRSSDIAGFGVRRRCQRLCDHALYKSGCGVNETLYKVDGTLATVNGLDLVSSAFSAKSDGWFVGGEIVIGYSRRTIKAHTTNTITITRSMDSAIVGATFRAYAGCDHTPTTCKDKFNNKLNYGGCEFLAVKNPFEESITY
jgi:hypothetical protein